MKKKCIVRKIRKHVVPLLKRERKTDNSWQTAWKELLLTLPPTIKKSKLSKEKKLNRSHKGKELKGEEKNSYEMINLQHT